MKLDKKAQQALSKLVARAASLNGTYFRSVEHRYMDPDTVLDGRRTELRGNRFAPVGTRATYVSDSDKTATEEVTGRKDRLGGKALIDLSKYPRVVFGVNVRLDRHVNLTRKFRSPLLEKIRQACLHEHDIGPSQLVGAFLASLGVQAVLFPSVVTDGKNLAIYVDNCPSGSLEIVNEAAFRSTAAKVPTIKSRP